MAPESKIDPPREDRSRPDPDAPDAAEQAFFQADEEAAAAEESEVDPELLRLPRKKRRRRHPLISILVIGFSLYLMYFIRSDLMFFFHSRTPTDVGQVQDALKQGLLTPNAFVKITGAPDRKHALLLKGRLSGYDNFFRLKRSNNRVFVQKHRARRISDKEITAVHSGQVVPFASLPYRKGLTDYLTKSMNIAHDLDFAQVKAAMAQRAETASAIDRDGARVELTADSLLWINVAYPGEWVVQFSKRAYESEQKPAAILTALGLPFARDSEGSKMFWRYVVLASAEQSRLLMERFKDRKLRIGVVRRQVSYSARWDQLTVKDKTLMINALDPSFPARYALQEDKLVATRPKEVPVEAGAILYITTSRPFSVPNDAVVILTDRAPGDNWYYALLFFVLISFMVINSVILYRRFGQKRENAEAAS